MQMVAWFEKGDQDPDATNAQHKPISRNEACAVLKNRIEDRKLLSRIKMMKSEAKYNCLCIKKYHMQTEHSLDSIRLCTGYALNEHRNTQSVPLLFYKNSDSKYSKNRVSSPSSEYDRKQVHFDQAVSPKSSNANIMLRSSSSQGTYGARSEPLYERKVHSAIARSGDLSQWNKFQMKKKKKEAERDNVVFEDSKMKKIYLNLCVQRDNIPKRSPQQIETLKKVDPVFAKRHKLYITAKMCNKAPKFDLNDYHIPTSMPKTAINRGKDEIIKVVNNVQFEKPKIFQLEMQRVEARVKKFVQTFSDF